MYTESQDFMALFSQPQGKSIQKLPTARDKATLSDNTEQYLLDIEKTACCKQLSAKTPIFSFLAASKMLQSGRNKAKSRASQSLCPSRVSPPRHQYKHPSVTSQQYQICLALLSRARQLSGHWPAYRCLTELLLSCPVNSPVTFSCPSQKTKVAGRGNAFPRTRKFCTEPGTGTAVI